MRRAPFPRGAPPPEHDAALARLAEISEAEFATLPAYTAASGRWRSAPLKRIPSSGPGEVTQDGVDDVGLDLPPFTGPKLVRVRCHLVLAAGGRRAA